MNNKGQIMIYGVMVALCIIILALALAPAVVESTEGARNATVGDQTGLDCNNASISNFDKAACISTDSTSWYFIGALIFIGGGLVTAKLVFA